MIRFEFPAQGNGGIGGLRRGDVKLDKERGGREQERVQEWTVRTSLNIQVDF